MIELLAPAKNLEQGIAAINHGADAVYIAGPRFGAREAAGNPMEDLEKLADYAHRYYAKVYMVLNTIIYDNELKMAEEQAKAAYNIGCDALIVQDMALMEMQLPPIPLFASTQTDNRTPERVKFLQDVGFQRVILARELSLEEIGAIHNVADSVELEAFAHGSLCVSYSGQCYISSAFTGRSANRGTCAQLCRLPYDLVDAKDQVLVKQKHLLSMKDLNLSNYLEQMIEVGVSSFKIEGRLKDMGYVKNITAYYRKQLDEILTRRTDLRKASSGTVTSSFEPDPEKSFSRGFTSYFIKGRNKNLNAISAKSTGKFLGTVSAVFYDYFTLDRNSTIPENGDGVCFIEKTGEINGLRINKVENEKIYPLRMQGLAKGTKLFRNLDYAFEKQLNSETATRQIEVRIKVEIRDTCILVEAMDEDGITSQAQFEHQGELARNAEAALKTIQEQISKTGGTPFHFRVEHPIGKSYFFPVSIINAWRRELIGQILENREKARHQRECKIIPNSIPYPSKQLDYSANVSNKLATAFYLRHGVETVTPAFEIDAKKNAGLMHNRYCIKFELGMCPVKQGATPSGTLFLRYKDKKLELCFDCKNCEMTIKEAEIRGESESK